ncbi:MAG TPA: PilZ domain-containing protein [Tepidisphaeraceae bacterium]|nr:PilZ domain-containing protein [Tepidisphaeraceae bacterium]
MTDRHSTTSAQRPANGNALNRGAIERRRSIRHPLGATGTVTLDDSATDPRQLQVMVMNVSLHGVGFRSPVEFREGGVFQVRIGAGPLHLSSKFEVVSSRMRGDGTWDVGGKFV